MRRDKRHKLMKENKQRCNIITLSKLLSCANQISENPRFLANFKLSTSMIESLVKVLKSKNTMECLSDGDKINIYQTLSTMLMG